MRLDGDEVSVDMGAATVGEHSTASIDGVAFPGVAVDVGNPHLACVTDADIDHLDLTRPPGHDPALFPHGVNVEFVSPLGSGDEVVMRVHERGVGITEACGTGACAAAWAARTWGLVASGLPAVVVHMDGGTASVRFDGTTAELTGPATYIADIEVERP